MRHASGMTEQQVPAPAIEAAAKATSVADLMSPPIGIFRADETVAQTVEQLRTLTKEALITYGFVTDEAGKLEGVVVMRDLLLAQPEDKLGDLMIRSPFSLPANMPLNEALKAALSKHFPVYPVCDADGVLRGLIRGEELFAEQVVEISAQAGSMVGVEKEERFSTPFTRSLKLRHPWLQINLLTAFLAAAVVGLGATLPAASTRAPARTFINFMRATPLLWQLIFGYFGIVLGLRIELSTYQVAILILGLNAAAYTAEIFRACAELACEFIEAECNPPGDLIGLSLGLGHSRALTTPTTSAGPATGMNGRPSSRPPPHPARTSGSLSRPKASRSTPMAGSP